MATPPSNQDFLSSLVSGGGRIICNLLSNPSGLQNATTANNNQVAFAAAASAAAAAADDDDDDDAVQLDSANINNNSSSTDVKIYTNKSFNNLKKNDGDDDSDEEIIIIVKILDPNEIQHGRYTCCMLECNCRPLFLMANRNDTAKFYCVDDCLDTFGGKIISDEKIVQSNDHRSAILELCTNKTELALPVEWFDGLTIHDSKRPRIVSELPPREGGGVVIPLYHQSVVSFILCNV